MDEPGKYLINVQFTASGVVERNDVVGAVFGQTEGLLGDELDLRSLQMADRVGRIDVDVDSEGGVSSGTIQIATNMDRVETAVLAAALETIERVGPCRASVDVDRIEDIRAAKRRWVFDRAQELVATGFEDVGVDGQDIVEAVRAATDPVEIGEYEGYPAGPGLAEEDEIIVVEGRSDVSRLLQYGITNVIGVEGTDVPDEVAALTHERTVTAFFDGDRGGDLILLELAQIGDIDYVTFAPPGRSVEDLGRSEVMDALADKVPYQPSEAEKSPVQSAEPSIRPHVADVIGGETGGMRILDTEYNVLAATNGQFAESLEDVDGASVVVVDATIGQREADLAARHDVDLVVGRIVGEFTKRPRSVRMLPADRILDRPVSPEQ